MRGAAQPLLVVEIVWVYNVHRQAWRRGGWMIYGRMDGQTEIEGCDADVEL